MTVQCRVLLMRLPSTPVITDDGTDLTLTPQVGSILTASRLTNIVKAATAPIEYAFEWLVRWS